MMRRAERQKRLLTVKARLQMSRFKVPATGRAAFKHAIEQPEKNTQEGALETLRWSRSETSPKCLSTPRTMEEVSAEQSGKGVG